MADRESREQEYLRRMRTLGYEPSLMGMDDEDIDWELQRMDGGREEARPAAQLNPTYRPVDRDFAERIFRMFARPFDPTWRMPDTSGPEYLTEAKRYGRIVEGKVPDVRPIVYGPNKGKDWPVDPETEESKKLREKLEKINTDIPERPPSKPPFRIIIGGKEYPVEIDKDGKLQIKF